MRLVVISGRSGSGKSSALHVLEDLGFYCIDNLPIGMLPNLVERAKDDEHLTQLAVSIDARNLAHEVLKIEQVLRAIPEQDLHVDIVYLDAKEEVLLQRFSSTRRKHPLTSSTLSLAEAIIAEKDLLAALANMADLMLDTTKMSVHELRSMIKQRITGSSAGDISILFESFGFKHGIPIDADYVFDVRHLPNPFWDIALRSHTGMEQPVKDFLAGHAVVADMIDDIEQFLCRWMPHYIDTNRSYMTIAIGCTGGQHRSVYTVEQLAERFSTQHKTIQIRHRELP